MYRNASCLIVALALVPVAATAQDAPASLSAYQGRTARYIWATEPGTLKKATVVRGDGRSITFAVAGEGEVTLPTSSVTRLEVFDGRKRHTWVGLLAGAALGVGLGYAAKVDADTCKDSYTTSCSRGEAVATYGGAGALVGALVGALIQSDRWTPIAVGGLLRSSALGSRGAPRLGVSLAIRF